MEYKLRLIDGGVVLENPSSNRWFVSHLIYLIITWAQIMYLVHILNQFMQNLKKPYYDAATRGCTI